MDLFPPSPPVVLDYQKNLLPKQLPQVALATLAFFGDATVATGTSYSKPDENNFP